MAAVTEKWNPHAKRRLDLFSFIDVLAVRGPDTVAIQTTSGSNLSARVNKIIALPEASAWLEGSQRRIVVHGWAKRLVVVGHRKRDGKPIKRKQYQVRIVEITAATFGDLGGIHQSLYCFDQKPELTPRPATDTVAT